MAAKISHRSPPPSPRKTEGSFGTLNKLADHKMARVGVALAARRELVSQQEHKRLTRGPWCYSQWILKKKKNRSRSADFICCELVHGHVLAYVSLPHSVE